MLSIFILPSFFCVFIQQVFTECLYTVCTMPWDENAAENISDEVLFQAKILMQRGKQFSGLNHIQA